MKFIYHYTELKKGVGVKNTLRNVDFICGCPPTLFVNSLLPPFRTFSQREPAKI